MVARRMAAPTDRATPARSHRSRARRTPPVVGTTSLPKTSPPRSGALGHRPGFVQATTPSGHVLAFRARAGDPVDRLTGPACLHVLKVRDAGVEAEGAWERS